MSSTETDLVKQRTGAEKLPPPEKYSLDAMFAPESVAVIGATDRPATVGRTILENLLHGKFHGKVYAVNARHSEVLGLKSYSSIGEVPQSVDMAVIATPAATVPQLIGECAAATCQVRRRDLCRLPGTGRSRGGSRTADPGSTAP